MKALLASIFRAMQRRKLGTPKEPVSQPTLRTNNVVQMDRRTAPRTTATGRKVDTAAIARNNALDQQHALNHSKAIARRPAEVVTRQTASTEDDYDWARRSAESAWPQPSFQTDITSDAGHADKLTANHAPNFHSGGGSFDGGGSSGDWSSSSSDSSSSSSCDSGSSSSGCD